MYTYDTYFFDEFENSSLKAARAILPEILCRTQAKSVLDFGCGEGVWLQEIKRINRDISILGIDGEYIKREELKIPIDCFRAMDLSKPFIVDEKYDLALCIEMAEHIEEVYSENLIDNITQSSDMVLFSAAIPGQGGVHHVNEQWQEYWIEKFENRNYFLDLSPRDFFWNNEQITPWRKQNLLFFSKTKKCLFPEAKPVRPLAHPEMFRLKVNNINNSVFYKESDEL